MRGWEGSSRPSESRPATVGLRALHPEPGFVLQEGDLLYLEGGADNAWRFSEDQLVQLGLIPPEEIERILGMGITLAEVTLAPRSEALGKTLTADPRCRLVSGDFFALALPPGRGFDAEAPGRRFHAVLLDVINN